MKDQDRKKAIKLLNEIMEFELSGVVRYTHYSLMVFGYNRIPKSVLARLRKRPGVQV